MAGNQSRLLRVQYCWDFIKCFCHQDHQHDHQHDHHDHHEVRKRGAGTLLSPLQRLPWEDLRGLDRVFTAAVISEKQKEHLSTMQEIFMVTLYLMYRMWHISKFSQPSRLSHKISDGLLICLGLRQIWSNLLNTPSCTELTFSQLQLSPSPSPAVKQTILLIKTKFSINNNFINNINFSINNNITNNINSNIRYKYCHTNNPQSSINNYKIQLAQLCVTSWWTCVLYRTANNGTWWYWVNMRRYKVVIDVTASVEGMYAFLYQNETIGDGGITDFWHLW